MQDILICITPASCEYDILHLPQHAKSPHPDSPPPIVLRTHIFGLESHIISTVNLSINLSASLRSEYFHQSIQHYIIMLRHLKAIAIDTKFLLNVLHEAFWHLFEKLNRTKNTWKPDA